MRFSFSEQTISFSSSSQHICISRGPGKSILANIIVGWTVTLINIITVDVTHTVLILANGSDQAVTHEDTSRWPSWSCPSSHDMNYLHSYILSPITLYLPSIYQWYTHQYITVHPICKLTCIGCWFFFHKWNFRHKKCWRHVIREIRDQEGWVMSSFMTSLCLSTWAELPHRQGSRTANLTWLEDMSHFLFEMEPQLSIAGYICHERIL